MNKLIFLFIIVFIFSGKVVFAQADNLESYQKQTSVSLTGSIRNDAYFSDDENNRFNDLIDGRLLFEKKEEKWTAVADGRIYLMYGDSFEEKEQVDSKIMRIYGRYYASFLSSEITAGKTFINIGINSVFNPFSINKNVNFTDITYDKEGLLSAEFKYFPGDLSEGNIFISYVPEHSNCITGFSNSFNAGSFDLGVAGIRIMHDNNHADETALENNHNKTGFFFKGDLFIGIQSSYAFHFDDEMGRYFHEADAGVDYSFFAGRLFTETLFYFNEAGETDSDKYRVVTDSVFKARYYNYSSFSIVISDFISTGMQSFVNICDYSYMLIPSFRFQPANAITLSLQGAYISGTGSQEFNRSAGGEYSIFVRTEIIF